jgi:hypothetical protein
MPHILSHRGGTSGVASSAQHLALNYMHLPDLILLVLYENEFVAPWKS